MKANDVIFYFAIKHNGNWDQIYDSIKNKEKFDFELFEKFKEKYKDNYITLLDENYPHRLKNIYKPPFILFYKGDINLLNCKKNLAIVGSRNNSMYGKVITETLVRDLKSKPVIISGFAKGIDSIAHNAALEANLSTIAILGCGINVCYPTQNTELYKRIETCGLIISEYPDVVSPLKENFPFRNRIIAALSDGILITEAKEKSGTSITVNFALNFGKNIYAVPDRILQKENSYCNSLIKDGAILVRNSEDIDEDFK